MLSACLRCFSVSLCVHKPLTHSFFANEIVHFVRPMSFLLDPSILFGLSVYLSPLFMSGDWSDPRALVRQRLQHRVLAVCSLRLRGQLCSSRTSRTPCPSRATLP